jgi:hypothetical protein
MLSHTPDDEKDNFKHPLLRLTIVFAQHVALNLPKGRRYIASVNPRSNLENYTTRHWGIWTCTHANGDGCAQGMIVWHPARKDKVFGIILVPTVVVAQLAPEPP